MKKFLLSSTILLLSMAGFSQSDKYQGAMETSLTSLYEAKTGPELQAASANFERIANAEKTQWLPYYYAAIGQIWRGFGVPNEQKDEVATQAEKLLDQAEALSPNNAEIFIARNMTSTIHMLVDPMTRWQTYGQQGGQALASAKKLDAGNPRIYYLEGQGLFGMPEQFGGGKANAKPLFAKSVALFETYKPVDGLSPNWGKKQAKEMLDQCN